MKFVQEGAFRIALPPRVFTTRCHNWLLHYCEEISQLHKHSPEAVSYYNEGVSLHSAGFLNKANPLYRKAIEIDPDLSEAWSNLGSVYVIQKLPNRAKLCFENALSCRDGEISMTLWHLAQLCSSEGDDITAADYWRKAMAVAESKPPDWTYPDLLKEYIRFLHKTHKDAEATPYEEKLKKYSRTQEGYRI